MLKESLTWKAKWTIEKYQNDDAFKSQNPFEVKEVDYNLALNEGINLLWSLVCGGAGTAFDNSNAYLGVGDSSAAEAATQTGLQAVTNKLYKGMEAGYPTYGTAQKATWRAVFDGTEANWAWAEFTVANGDSDASVNLNRKVSAQGTKVSGQIWTLQVEITLS